MEFKKVGEKDGLLILADSEGNRAAFEFIEMAVVDNTEYAALLQVTDDSIVLLQFDELSSGNEKYATIEDDAVFEKVASVFEKMFDED